jgi:hypothetical protein
MRAVAAIALICAFQALSAVALYERPINADCIQLGSGTDVVDLYPARYQIIGDGSTQGDAFTTEARSQQRLRPSSDKSSPPATFPARLRGSVRCFHWMHAAGSSAV